MYQIITINQAAVCPEKEHCCSAYEGITDWGKSRVKYKVAVCERWVIWIMMQQQNQTCYMVYDPPPSPFTEVQPFL